MNTASRGSLLDAVLTAPQQERFRELCDLGDAHLDVDVTGWSKHAIITADRVFLFPRHSDAVWTIEREADALEALAPLDGVPKLVARLRDGLVSPYPFMEVTRLPGSNYADVEESLDLEDVAFFLEHAGGAIASWHEFPVQSVPPHLRAMPDAERPPIDWPSRALDPATMQDALAEARELVPGHDGAWERAVGELAGLDDVVLHGDVCENNFMVDGELRVTGVLDWGGMRVGNPVRDFDFGEWGYGIFEFEEHFGKLRERMWESYRAQRSVRLPDCRALHLFWSLAEAVYFSRHQSNDWDRSRLSASLRNLSD